MSALTALRAPVRRWGRALSGARAARSVPRRLARSGAEAAALRWASRWLRALAALRPRLAVASPWGGALERLTSADGVEAAPSPPSRRSRRGPPPGRGAGPHGAPAPSPGVSRSAGSRRSAVPTPGEGRTRRPLPPLPAPRGAALRAVLDRLAGGTPAAAAPGAARPAWRPSAGRRRTPPPTVDAPVTGDGAPGWRRALGQRVHRRVVNAGGPPAASDGGGALTPPAPAAPRRPPPSVPAEALWLVPVAAGPGAPPELLTAAAGPPASGFGLGAASGSRAGTGPRPGAREDREGRAAEAPMPRGGKRGRRGPAHGGGGGPGSSTAGRSGAPMPGDVTASAPRLAPDSAAGGPRPGWAPFPVDHALERAAPTAPAQAGEDASPLRLPDDGSPAELDLQRLADRLERLLGDEARRYGLDV